jgi:hypothetical protein
MSALNDERRLWSVAAVDEETFLAWHRGHHARTDWQAEADRRWPDGWDMVGPAIGDGQYATVAWCGPLTVQLWETREDAERALARIDRSGCGGCCWGDHELVDLAEPEAIDPAAEWLRGPRRAAHAEACYQCFDWSGGRMPRAAMARAAARRRRGVAA